MSVWFDPVGILFGGYPQARWFGIAAPLLLFAWGISRGDALARIASVFAAGDVLFVLAVIEFLDVSTIFDTRLLVPVFVGALLVGALLLASLALRGRWAPWAAGTAVLFLVAHAFMDLRFARRDHSAGLGATIDTWRNSGIRRSSLGRRRGI